MRGGSLSGNAGAMDLAREDLVDILVADYHAPSLLHGALLFARQGVASLPEAVRTITATLARAAGFRDRGALMQGQRADVIVAGVYGTTPEVTHLIVGGAIRYAAFPAGEKEKIHALAPRPV